MNYRRHPDLIDKLAAEYVLGTLRHRARRRFERWIEEEPSVKTKVEFWQNKLNPLFLAVPQVAPPKRVWKSIQSDLFKKRKTKESWWDNARLWRWLGGAAFACTVFLAVYIVQLNLQNKAQPTYIAVLNNDLQKAAVVVKFDANSKSLELAQLALHSLPEKKTMELWVIPDTNVPVSLGVVENSKNITVSLRPDQIALLKQSKAIALSLEPLGGSPTGAPTGPILFSGAIAGKV